MDYSLAFEQRGMSMRCPACGTSIAAEAVFCQRCGSRVSVAGVVPAEDRNRRHAFEHDRGWSRPRDPRHGLLDNPEYVDDERLVWQGTYSWKGMIHEFLVAAAATFVLICAGAGMFRDATAWFYIVAFIGTTWLLLGGVLVFRKLNFRYMVTGQRLIPETGILYRILDRTEMIDVDDVRVEQGIIERIVNVGKIRLRTSDKTHPTIFFRGIYHVREVASTIDDARRRERMRRGLHIESV